LSTGEVVDVVEGRAGELLRDEGLRRACPGALSPGHGSLAGLRTAACMMSSGEERV
jgi:hypothetical protein